MLLAHFLPAPTAKLFEADFELLKFAAPAKLAVARLCEGCLRCDRRSVGILGAMWVTRCIATDECRRLGELALPVLPVSS